MARRFGRNQRRRAREALAEAQTNIAEVQAKLFDMTAANNMNMGLMKHFREVLDAVQAELQRAKDIAGNMSILFPPPAEPVTRVPADWDGPVQVFAAQKSTDWLPSLDGQVPDQALELLPLDLLLSNIREDVLNQSLHCYVRFGDDKLVYGITPRARYSLPRLVAEKDLTLRIGESLAREFIKLQKGRKPR